MATPALDLDPVGKTPENTHTCEAYDSFKRALMDVRNSYKHLNPISGGLYRGDGTSSIEPQVVDEFLRGAVISVLSIWEHFVYNLFGEAYNHVIHISSETSTPEDSSDDSDSQGSYRDLRKIKKEWPNSQRVLQNAIKRRGEREKKPVEVVAFRLMMSSCPHRTLFQEHRDYVLRGCTPLLLGPGGIDETFSTLFSTKKSNSLTRTIVMLGVQFSFTTAAGVAGVVCIQTESTVHDILRLYYGARCIFSHGLPSRTLSEGGAASNFPSEHDLAIGMGFAPAAADLVKFFQRLKEMGRKAAPTYLDLCMMYRFFFRLANRLMVAVGCHVRNLSPKQPELWNCTHYFMGDKKEMIREPVSLDDV